MTCELQSTLEDSRIKWPILRNYIPCVAHVIQLALSAFMSSLSVTDRAKSWDAHERDQQCVENESIDSGKSQELWKEGNARINKVLAMKPGLAQIIEQIHTSKYFESSETELHKAENASFIDYANFWLSTQVHWMSKSQSPHHSTINYGCEDTLELNHWVACTSLPIMRIPPPVAPKFNIHWSAATLHKQDKWTILKYVMVVLRPFR